MAASDFDEKPTDGDIKGVEKQQRNGSVAEGELETILG